MYREGGIINIEDVKHQKTIEKLVMDSSPRRPFLFMILVASMMAALGLLNDSAAVVIGAMLVAPLLWPVLGVAMGVVTRDVHLLKLSFVSILLSAAIGIVVGMLITLGYVPLGTTREIFQQTNIGFMLPVAIASGAAAAVAVSYETIKESLPGIALSVALMPPLVVIGIGLGGTDWELMRRATELFLVNLLGIIATSSLVFFALGFHKYTRVVERAVVREERELMRSK